MASVFPSPFGFTQATIYPTKSVPFPYSRLSVISWSIGLDGMYSVNISNGVDWNNRIQNGYQRRAFLKTLLILRLLLSIYLSFRSCDSCRRLPEPKHHSSLFNHWSASKCLVFMAARTNSNHVFLGRPLFLLSPGIHSIINFGSLSSCILLTWLYHWSLFLSMMSIMSGFSFTPIISFICSFFILSILAFLADLLSTSISVNKILLISQRQ